jgi:hypothetical protein
MSSPPGAAPVHTCDRRTDRSPATTPIAAPPHRRTRRDGRPGNDGHRRRCDSGGRRLSYRWRGRDLEVCRMSGHEHRRRERQCGDNREKTLTQDILQWAAVNTTQNPNRGSLVSRLLWSAGSLSVRPVDEFFDFGHSAPAEAALSSRNPGMSVPRGFYVLARKLGPCPLHRQSSRASLPSAPDFRNASSACHPWLRDGSDI